MVHGTAKSASNVKNGEIGTARSARSVPSASAFRATVVVESAAPIMIRRQMKERGTAIEIACDSDSLFLRGGNLVCEMYDLPSDVSTHMALPPRQKIQQFTGKGLPLRCFSFDLWYACNSEHCAPSSIVANSCICWIYAPLLSKAVSNKTRFMSFSIS